MIIEYQKIINLLQNKPNQPTKFRTKSYLVINDDCVEHTTLIVKLNVKRQC